jgi:hypothetical protein
MCDEEEEENEQEKEEKEEEEEAEVHARGTRIASRKHHTPGTRGSEM